RVLSEEGITLTEEDYFGRYLALDDRGCFELAFAERGAPLTEDRLNELVKRKSELVEPTIHANLQILPGVTELIHRASEVYPLAVASGALRHEVELILKYGGLRNCFGVVVGAEDVARSKPHPDPFLKACELLNTSRNDRIEPHSCLVIEDSIHGIRAAHLAGMRCVAVANSYPVEKLAGADQVVCSLADFSVAEAESLFSV